METSIGGTDFRMKALTRDSVLSVADVCVDIGAAKVLQHVSFSVCNGDVVAVMGPTGSGKTTLLNAIAGRLPLSAGQVYLSGKHFSKGLRRRLGFVIQHDVFFSNLTLWETLYFTAMVTLPESVSKADKIKRLENIIDLLQLEKCKNTVIGNIFIKGLSGGEKKRVSIASTLLKDPDIVLLDEPTSGLDSTMALQIVKQLKTLASEYRKTVIVTIHQPSSQVYHMFDNLLLLARGKVVYNGAAHREPLNFFEQSGYVCDPNFNPADFIMDILSSDESEINELVKRKEILQNESTNVESIGPGSTSTLSSAVRYSSNSLISITTSGNDVNILEGERWPTGFAMQFRMLTWRSFKQSRSTFLYVYSVIEIAILGVLSGLLLSENVKDFRNLMGIVFYVVVQWSFAPGFQALMIFPADIQVISKERASGTYRLSALYVSKLASELPLTITVPTLFYLATFWIARLGGVRKFFITWSILLLSAVSVQGLGLFVSIMFPDGRLAMVVFHAVLHFALLFSGFLVQDFPDWLAWGRYLSLMHYPFSAITTILTDDAEPLSCNATDLAKFPKCLQNSSDYVTSMEILRDVGIDHPVYFYIGILALVCVAFRVAVYLALRLKRLRIN